MPILCSFVGPAADPLVLVRQLGHTTFREEENGEPGMRQSQFARQPPAHLRCRHLVLPFPDALSLEPPKPTGSLETQPKESVPLAEM